jgi:hypothetical protein
LEAHSRGSKISIAGIAIALVGGLLMTYFHLSLTSLIIFVVLIVIGTVLALLMPRISQKIGWRWPLFRKGVTSETESQVKGIPMTQRTVIVHSQETLPRWEEIFAKTRTEIWFIGITLETVHQKTSQIENLLNTKKVRILLLKSDSILVPRYERLVKTNDITNTINRTITELIRMRDRVSANQRKNLEIKKHDEISAYSSIIVDPINDEGSMQIEPYPFGIARSDRRNFLISNKTEKALFKAFHDGFKNLWDAAESI